MNDIWIVVDEELCISLYNHPINERPGSMVMQLPTYTTLHDVLVITEAKIDQRIEGMEKRGMT